MEKILVTEEGYKQYFEILESLKNKLLSNASDGNEAYKDAVGDGWHDNFAFEEAMRNERDISNRIQKMIDNAKYLKIIKIPKYEDNKVNINDIIKVCIVYDEDDTECEYVKLTGNYMSVNDSDVNEVTLNSPIGSAIYMKDINSSAYYYVGDRKIKIDILDKK